MAKDPAFLFYSKDWLEGTAEMTHEEKGVYIDLLAHQHQKGSIPSDIKRLCRMLGLSQDAFDPIWQGIKSKFYNHSVDRMVNRKLTEVTTERSTKSHVNGITGRFAVLIRSVEPKYRQSLKDEFNIEDYKPFSTEEATERLTKWFEGRLPFLANANANINKIGGEGERKENGFICYDIEKQLLAEQKNFEAICMKTYKKEADAKNSLRKYHLWLQENEKYPKNKTSLYAGFEKWLMNETGGDSVNKPVEKKMHY